jgi:hypothetical protein
MGLLRTLSMLWCLFLNMRLRPLNLPIMLVLRLQLPLELFNPLAKMNLTPDTGQQQPIQQEQSNLVQVVGLEQTRVVEDHDVGGHGDQLEELNEWGLIEMQEPQREEEGHVGQAVVVEALGGEAGVLWVGAGEH